MAGRSLSFWPMVVALIIFLLTILTILISTELAANKETALFLVGTNVWPGYEPLYLARDLGFFPEDQIRLVEYSSSTQTMRSFRNGTIQGAALTLDEALSLYQTGADSQVILILDVSEGADAILAKPEIRSMKDLKGKRIGVESAALGAFMISRALQLSGMSPQDVIIIPLEIDEHVDVFNKGEVDAVVTFEPVRTNLLDQGASEIFNSAMIPGEIVDLLVVNKQYLKDHPKRINLFLRGWFSSLRYFKEYPRKAAQIMADRLRLPTEEILNSFSGLTLLDLEKNVEELSGDPSPLLANSLRIQKFMVKAGLLKRELDLKEFIRADPVITLFRQKD